MNMYLLSVCEHLWKLIKNHFVQNPYKKKIVVNHFLNTGFVCRTVYTAINRIVYSNSIKGKIRTGRKSTWISNRKQRLKRLVNNEKGVRQRKLYKEIQITQPFISYELSKMSLNNYKREKKHCSKQATKATEKTIVSIQMIKKNVRKR